MDGGEPGYFFRAFLLLPTASWVVEKLLTAPKLPV